MKPEAIQAAAAELLTQIEATKKPASEVMNAYVRARRYIGSKDRRRLTDLVWNYIRHYRRLGYLYPDAGIEEKVSRLDDVPDLIPEAPFDVNMEVPAWLVPLIPEAKTELPALLDMPCVVLRANGNRDKVMTALAAEGVESQPTKLSPYGLILTKRVNLNALKAYREGLIEVQDEGSQCVALETEIRAGEKVLDYCAGAGGKSLIFAQMMGNVGEIVAHDVSQISLRELELRAKRAKARCIRIEKEIKNKLFDHVVVDAPCSGTGTWRRCPDARWKLTEKQVATLVKKQAAILDEAVRFVRMGGKLSYMTCSLTRVENTEQAAAFVARHPAFRIVKQRQFSPAKTGTDGLFITVFQREIEKQAVRS